MNILQGLYDSEINFKLSCFWDGGIDVELGDEVNGILAKATLDTVDEAVEWLAGQACKFFPGSEFAKGRREALSVWLGGRQVEVK